MNGLPRALLEDLRCPCCGAKFEVAVECVASGDHLNAGVLACDCYEYPVVEGIAVLRQMSPVSSTRNEAVVLLRKGDSNGALAWLLEFGSAPGVSTPRTSQSVRLESIPFLGYLLGRLSQGRTTSALEDLSRIDDFEAALRAIRPRGYSDYLYQRFANPSLLGAIPPLLVLGDACRRSGRGRLLDLLCGTGHSSSTVAALCPGVDVVMADFDFVNLYIAKRFLSPTATALCVDAEIPLPFADRSVDAVFCMDGLHYVRSKMALLEQIDRIVCSEGAWLFAHMHNAACDNVNAGTPLDALEYRERFAFGEQRVFGESQIVREFRETGSLDLTYQAEEGVVANSPALTLMGSRGNGLWQRYLSLDDRLLACPDRLALNPLYRVEAQDGELFADAVWPSESLKRECLQTDALFPECIRISADLANSIASPRNSDPVVVRELVRSFLLVSLPECYRKVKNRVSLALLKVYVAFNSLELSPCWMDLCAI